MTKIEQLIQQYDLQPHPEGGWYKQTYKSSLYIPATALPPEFRGDRVVSTAICFLLGKEDFSAFHRIKSDECWHFYAGDPLCIHILHLNGMLETVGLGNNISEGRHFQHVVPAGCWFASEPAPGSVFSFVGCTVAPGFDFADFELAKANELSRQYPQHEKMISRLCR